VVNRFLQARHWRRRLITLPASLERESTTLSRFSLQNGHLTGQTHLKKFSNKQGRLYKTTLHLAKVYILNPTYSMSKKILQQSTNGTGPEAVKFYSGRPQFMA